MYVIIFFLLLAPAWGISSPEDREITDPKLVSSVTNQFAEPLPLEDFFLTRSISGAAWSPKSNDIVLSTNLTGRVNLWKVSAGGSWPVQLAVSDDRQVGGVWSPDGEWLVFEQDHSGDEQYDLYALPRNGGRPINLTNTPDIREFGASWSLDGKTIALVYRPKDAPSSDIAVLDWNSRKVRRLTRESDPQYNWSTLGWSPDGKILYAVRATTEATDSAIFSIDLSTGKTTELTPHAGKMRYIGEAISPDGKYVLVTSNAKNGYDNVALLDIATKTLQWITNSDWECNAGVFSPDGLHFTYEVNEDGRRDIYLADMHSLRARKLRLPEGVNRVTGAQPFSPDGRQLLVGHSAANTPGDLWVYDMQNDTARQLTFNAIASLNPSTIPGSQLVHYRSFDGKIISAFLYMPFNLRRDGKNPTVLYPHGGPAGQSEDGFNRIIGALVTHGYIVLAANPRGSTGYGIEFEKCQPQRSGRRRPGRLYRWN